MKRRTAKRLVCANGHIFFKSSDGPACPECEAARNRRLAFVGS